jgi:hypothetical protein
MNWKLYHKKKKLKEKRKGVGKHITNALIKKFNKLHGPNNKAWIDSDGNEHWLIVEPWTFFN